MRLEFEPNVAAFPLIENEVFDDMRVSPDSELLLKKGISAAQAGDRKLARQLLIEVTEIAPRSADALMWLASISEYPEELLAFLDRVLEIEPDNSKAVKWHTATRTLLAKTFVQRGIESHNNGDNELALQSFEQAIAHDHDCEMAWFWKASLADDDGDRVEFLHRVLSINVENEEAQHALDEIKASRADSRFTAARAAAAAGDNESAIEILDELLERYPEKVDALILRSHLSHDLADKLSCLAKALDIEPDNAAARATYDFLAVSIPMISAPVEEAAPEIADEKAPEPVEIAGDDEQAVAYEFGTEESSAVEIADEPVAMNSDDDQPFEYELHTEESPADEVVGEAVAETDDNAQPAVYEFETDERIDAFTEIVEPVAYEPILDEDELTRQLVAPVEEWINADRDTLESLPVADVFEEYSEPVFEQAEEEEVWQEEYSVPEVEFAAPEPLQTDEVVESNNSQEVFAKAEHTAPDEMIRSPAPASLASAETVACPFCSAGNAPNIFECDTCRATLTLSDIDSLISNPRVDHEALQSAVTQMEGEWNLREFDATELISLGIGHFNLRNYSPGVKYLQEASLLRPNDVILSGQINSLVIRLDELRRKNELDDSRPKGRTILVVDDSATVRKLISGKLEKSGHTVVCAVDGVEGLERIAEQIPDLVLLDITMPNMDGYEVCRQIRANPDSRDIPVVMISGKDGFFDKVRGRMAGTTAYITKPFGPETLMKALESYLVNSNGSSI